MKQKFLISIVLFTVLCFIFTFSFAAESLNTIKDSVSTMGHAAGNMVNTTTSSISNGVKDISSKTRDVVENVADDTSDMFGMQESNYNATRTSNNYNNNLFGLSTNAWLWIIMGIVGAIIIGLVWYYGSQYENQSYNHTR